MIKVKHSNPAKNQTQEAMLVQFPETDRRFHELMFSYGMLSTAITRRQQRTSLRIRIMKSGWKACRRTFPGIWPLKDSKGAAQCSPSPGV